jgi:hypothetical protein
MDLQHHCDAQHAQHEPVLSMGGTAIVVLDLVALAYH